MGDPIRIGVIKEDLDEINRLANEIFFPKAHYDENEIEMLKGFIKVQRAEAMKIRDILTKYAYERAFGPSA